MQPNVLPRPKAVLFDWDGTLVDTIPLIQSSINHILAQYNKPPIDFSSAAMASVAGSTGAFIHALGEIEGSRAKAQYEDYMDNLYMAAGGPISPQLARPGAAEILRDLCDVRIPVGIATNKMWRRFEIERDALGFTPFISTAVTLDQVSNRKPHPEMIELAINRLGLVPGPDIWMIGDHRVDSESAKQAGLTAIHLAHGFHVSDTHPPDFIAVDLATVSRLIRGLPTGA